MKEIANDLEVELEIRDARQVISTDAIEIHFHPDDRGFSYITCKIQEESLETILEKYIERYKQ